MRLMILLAMLAIALPFIVSQAAMPYGVAVSLRFLERPTNSLKPKYTIPAESDNAVTLIGIDRKGPPQGQGDAIDPNATWWLNQAASIICGHSFVFERLPEAEQAEFETFVRDVLKTTAPSRSGEAQR